MVPEGIARVPCPPSPTEVASEERWGNWKATPPVKASAPSTGVASEVPVPHVRKRDPSEESRGPEIEAAGSGDTYSVAHWERMLRNPRVQYFLNFQEGLRRDLSELGVLNIVGQDGLHPLVPREDGGHLDLMSRVVNDPTYMENLSGLMESPVVVGRRIPTLIRSSRFYPETPVSGERVPEQRWLRHHNMDLPEVPPMTVQLPVSLRERGGEYGESVVDTVYVCNTAMETTEQEEANSARIYRLQQGYSLLNYGVSQAIVTKAIELVGQGEAQIRESGLSSSIVLGLRHMLSTIKEWENAKEGDAEETRARGGIQVELPEAVLAKDSWCCWKELENAADYYAEIFLASQQERSIRKAGAKTKAAAKAATSSTSAVGEESSKVREEDTESSSSLSSAMETPDNMFFMEAIKRVKIKQGVLEESRLAQIYAEERGSMPPPEPMCPPRNPPVRIKASPTTQVKSSTPAVPAVEADTGVEPPDLGVEPPSPASTVGTIGDVWSLLNVAPPPGVPPHLRLPRPPPPFGKVKTSASGSSVAPVVTPNTEFGPKRLPPKQGGQTDQARQFSLAPP